MSESTFTDAKVIELSRSFVNVIAHRETAHGDHEALVGREKVKLCNEYFDIPCSVHVKGESVVGKFFQGTFGTPSTVFCDPTGKEISKATGGLSSGELMKKMNEALGKVTGDQSTRKSLADGDAFLSKSEFKKAIEAFQKVGKVKGEGFKKESDEALVRANEAGEKLLKEALALDNAEEKKKALRKISEDFKPLAVAAEAKKELDALK